MSRNYNWQKGLPYRWSLLFWHWEPTVKRRQAKLRDFWQISGWTDSSWNFNFWTCNKKKTREREKNEWPFSAGYWDLFRNEVQKSRGARASAHENLRLSAQARKKRNSCGEGEAAARASRKWLEKWELETTTAKLLNYKGHHGHLLLMTRVTWFLKNKLQYFIC